MTKDPWKTLSKRKIAQCSSFLTHAAQNNLLCGKSSLYAALALK